MIDFAGFEQVISYLTSQNKDCMLASLTIPYPPSVNHVYGIRRGGKGKYITADGKKFIYSVIAETLKCRADISFAGDVAIEILEVQKTKYRRDYDNPLKALNDALVKADVIKDDKQIKFAVVAMTEPDKSIKEGYAVVNLYDLDKIRSLKEFKLS